MKLLHLLITGSLLWAGPSAFAQAGEPQNHDVAIIIGNKNYVDDEIPDVRFADNDARAIRHFVQDVLHIRDENVIFMEDATQARMQSAFGREGNFRGKAFQYVKPGISNLYVFYSGHGLPGRNDAKRYLLPVDAEIETADINGYPVDLLYENLRQIGARSVTVLLDACFSGNSDGGPLITNASGATVLPVTSPLLPQKQDPGFTIITAASQDQLASWDEESHHGLFTEYLLRALYGDADKDKDGTVRLAEVSSYLNDEMRYKARRTYNRDQVPSIEGKAEQVLVSAVNGIYPSRPASEQAQEKIETPVDPPVIDTGNYQLYPVEQNMFALKNANVRKLPTVRSPKVMMFPKGEPVYVAAKIIDQPWYAIERGEGIIGYIFADLLGEEKEIATEEENRSIRELKKRLEKLESQTRLSEKNLLPPPPASDAQQDEAESVSSQEMLPPPDWNAPRLNREEVATELKTMGAILARQSFIETDDKLHIYTSFKYNWIRIEEERCLIKASVSLRHEAPYGTNINIHDRRIEIALWRNLRIKKRTLRTRNKQGEIIKRTIVYQYGPLTFKSSQDRRDFIVKARQITQSCPVPQRAQSNIQSDIIGARPQINRRPTPPPPPFRRPPPPRR